MRNKTGLVAGFLGTMLVAAPLDAQSFVGADGPARTGFGQSVLVGDGEIFIGEPMNAHTNGLVYVYRRVGGEWIEAAQLNAEDAETGDYFGRAMGLEGTSLLIGATAIRSSTGALYVFNRGRDGRWVQAQRIVPSANQPGDSFGRVAAVKNGVALFTALGADSGAGAVYVFRRNREGRWVEEARLQSDAPERNQWFGSALAVDGNRAVIGAFRENGNHGAAYVFRYDPATKMWSHEAKLTPRTLGDGDRLGTSVLLSGDRAGVGAPGHDGGVGVVYGFARDAGSGSWNETMQLLPFDGARNHQFGSALVMNGDELWVSAPGANGSAGRVYLYRHNEVEITGVRKMAARSPESGDFFGATLDVRGDLAVVGLTNDDHGEGTAAIFTRTPGGEWTEVKKVWSESGTVPPITGAEVTCDGGMVSVFSCADVDLLSFLPVSAVGGSRGVLMLDVWGWTDPETGKEWAVAARMDGTSFIDISDPYNPRFVASLPFTEGARPSFWRDVKVYENHAYIVADGSGAHGMQVFDLTRLRRIQGVPQTLQPDYVYGRVNSVHNIAINENTGFAYAVGASGGGETCGGGLHMIDLREPKRPTFAGCFADATTGRQRTGYTHDAHCVIYAGPDEEHRGKELCFGANETALSIADVTDKNNPIALAMAEYPNVAYSHQGWLTEDQRYFFMGDELDELQGFVDKTRTLVWDVSDLDDPVLVKEFFGTTGATDHNLYIRGDRMYQSNYLSGLRVLDVSEPENPHEIAYFDTAPYGEDSAQMFGSWSNYPFFASGVIVVTSMREGVFVLKKREARPIP